MSARSLVVLLVLLPLSSALGAGLTLESIFLDAAHDGPDRASLQWIEDGAALLRADTDDSTLVLTRVDARNGRSEDVLRVDPWTDPVRGEVEAEAAVLGPDGRHLILKTRGVQRWRRSTAYDHWVHDLETGDRWRLTDGGGELHVAFEPGGDEVAFVQGSFLHRMDLRTRASRSVGFASDGTPLLEDHPELTHGDPDWVYEEEFDFSHAFWWANDGDRLAFLRFDRTGVERFPMVVTGEDAMPSYEPFDYPKAGARNSQVSIWVWPAGEGAAREIARVTSEDGYLVRARFTPDGESLVYQILDRDQKRLRVYRRDLGQDRSGESVLILEESADAWVEVDRDLHLLADGTFLWTSRRSGFRHVYRGNLDGGPLEQVSRGDFDVRSIVGANTDHAIVLTARTRPVDAVLERLDLETGALVRLSDEHGWSSADVSSDAESIVHSWSTATHRTRVELIDADGRRRAMLHDDSMNDFADHPAIDVEFRTVPIEGGPAMWGRITRRADFVPQERHPVLIYVYGGPAAQAARDSWHGVRGLFHRMLVERGWVVVTADGRGSAGRGVEYETATYLNLGTHEIDDQVHLVDWLRAQSWVDPDAIAIHGGSYGGYASIGAMIRAEGRIAAAMAAAPVTDWRFYDTGYTERFMLTPQVNPEGYANGSWLDEVEGMQGALLLVHGTGDDNVHDQHSHRLIEALVDAHVPFDLMIYPDKAHALKGAATRYDLYRRHVEHLRQHVAPVADAPAGATR